MTQDEPKTTFLWRRRLFSYGLAIFALLAVAFGVAVGTGFLRLSASPTIEGRVLALNGDPVAAATVVTPAGTARTNAEGWFEVEARFGTQWVTVDHPEFLSRTRAGLPGEPLLIRLTPDDGETIALHFVGDVMFGRRFYDPNEDGDTGDGLLQVGAGPDEHFALLEQVEPLLANAHLTVVNLETPLTDDPYYAPTDMRPAEFHPTKEFAFASSPAAGVALREAGVDIVGLANNHMYDTLDGGIADTLASIQKASFVPGTVFQSFGIGLTEAEAWEPAVVTVKGQTLAFLGCTTITGVEHSISYVAEGLEKSGAAACEEDAIRQKVSAAAARFDLVVFMIHGGYEYGRDPSGSIVRLTTVAREAGATLVINHHPHVVGGFDWNSSSLVAWTLGNFLFDQTVWPTFESYLLAVHLRDGKVIRAYTEPIMIEGFVPHGVTGELATYVARGAAGREEGPFLVEDGAMEVDVSGLKRANTSLLSLDGGSGAGSVYELNGDWSLSGFAGEGRVRPGRDLLWTGDFEDTLIDSPFAEGALWNLSGNDTLIGEAYAYEGETGVRLRRKSSNETDVVLTPLHRILVDPDGQLSVIGRVRADAGAEVALQLSWYPDTKGLSSAQTVEAIPLEGDDVWQAFRFDAVVPPGVVAVGLYLRLAPPEEGRVTADFDNLRLIEWAPDGYEFSPLYTHARVYKTVTLRLRREFLPGAEDWAKASLEAPGASLTERSNPARKGR